VLRVEPVGVGRASPDEPGPRCSLLVDEREFFHGNVCPLLERYCHSRSDERVLPATAAATTAPSRSEAWSKSCLQDAAEGVHLPALPDQGQPSGWSRLKQGGRTWLRDVALSENGLLGPDHPAADLDPKLVLIWTLGWPH
jgi:hypothetical protein